MNKESGVEYLKNKYEYIVTNLKEQGCYIWGAGKLGTFTSSQCQKNNVVVHGIIDSFVKGVEGVSDPSVLKQDSIVIIASFYYPDIIQNLKEKGMQYYIYYEELALMNIGFEVYYEAFINIFEELESNISQYEMIQEILADDLSKNILKKIINFRKTLDYQYTVDALEMSLEEGIQDFDKCILDKLNEEKYSFFDCGGFDGQTTLDFLHQVKNYNKVYFFEPDKEILEKSKRRLSAYSNIDFIQAGVGRCLSEQHYNAIGGGAGYFCENGTDIIKIVPLDLYGGEEKSYIKIKCSPCQGHF